jgi:hypothetical protein
MPVARKFLSFVEDTSYNAKALQFETVLIDV